jgi:hypothetical protein
MASFGEWLGCAVTPSSDEFIPVCDGGDFPSLDYTVEWHMQNRSGDYTYEWIMSLGSNTPGYRGCVGLYFCV